MVVHVGAYEPGKRLANKMLHRTAIPLRSIAAGELDLYTVDIPYIPQVFILQKT